MLTFLTTYFVPFCVFLLMIVVGSEINADDIRRLFKNPRAVLVGSVGQLLILPIIAVVIQRVASVPPAIAYGVTLLSLCPSGGISNYYCYLARANVMLSSTIIAIGTALSLFTIPLWLAVLNLDTGSAKLPEVPVTYVFTQLVAFMIVPMCIGAWLRHRYSVSFERIAILLRRLSLGLIIAVLLLVISDVFNELAVYLFDIIKVAALFLALGMLLGWLLGCGLSARDQSVLIIESAVRNVGIAILLGSHMLDRKEFGFFASFLTGYFALEIIIMVGYASYRSRKFASPQIS